ncbi:MAG: epoxyqueuosine reductase, partial [Clostridioides sp.]|nr:epoxyqueuosine reductase [Clostridioides sp.]
MKSLITNLIIDFVADYQKNPEIKTKWKTPIVGFSSANDPLYSKLKDVVGEHHMLPKDFSQNSKSIISYFIPFVNEIPNSNNNSELLCSEEWALAY